MTAGKYASGAFNTNTSTGNQSVTGLGFQPQAVLFWGWGKTSTLAATADAAMFAGAATSSTARWYTSRFSKDAQAGAGVIAVNNVSNKCFGYKDNTGVIFEADFVSMDSDGFTFNLTTAPGTARYIFWVALGGLSNAKAGTFTTNLVTGNQSITGVGFQPTFMLFKGENTSGTVHDDLGCAVSSSSRWHMNNFTTSASPSRAKNYYGHLLCYSKWGDGSAQNEDDFVSMDADGFTINSTTNNGVAQTINYLAFSGPTVAVGNLLSGTTSADVVITGVGFAPGLILLASASFATTTENSQAVDAIRSFGAGINSLNRRFYTYLDIDNVVTTQCKENGSEAGIAGMMSSGTTGVIVQQLDLKSFSNDGFTLSIPTTDNQSRRYYYIAFEGNPIASSTSIPLLPMMGVG